MIPSIVCYFHQSSGFDVIFVGHFNFLLESWSSYLWDSSKDLGGLILEWLKFFFFVSHLEKRRLIHWQFVRWGVALGHIFWVIHVQTILLLSFSSLDCLLFTRILLMSSSWDSSTSSSNLSFRRDLEEDEIVDQLWGMMVVGGPLSLLVCFSEFINCFLRVFIFFRREITCYIVENVQGELVLLHGYYLVVV